MDPDVTIQQMAHERGLLFHSEVPNAVSGATREERVASSKFQSHLGITELRLIYTEFRICGWPFVRSQAAPPQ
jgi:hypothetical protein